MTTIDLAGGRLRSALADQLSTGTPYALLFAGQGNAHRARIAELRSLHGAELDADRLWNDALARLAPVIGELAAWWPTDPAEDDWHPRLSGTDEHTGRLAERWLDPAASVPDIAYAQLLELRAMQLNGLDLTSAPPTTVVGHSQGLLTAAVAAGALDGTDALALAHLIGVAAARIGRHAGVATEPGRRPMLAVTGIGRAAIHEHLDALGAAAVDAAIGVVNGPDRHAIVGPPAQLEVVSASFVDDNDRRGRRTSAPRVEPVDIAMGFHHPALAPAARLALEWAAKCGIRVAPPEGDIANHLDRDDLLASIITAVISDPFDWPSAVERLAHSGATWVVDVGPDPTAARLAQRLCRGLPLGFCSPRADRGVSELFTPGAAPTLDVPDAEFAPSLIEADGKVLIETRLTRTVGQSAFVLAGMTPTTSDAPIVAAAANAGVWAELAGGGQVTGEILLERFRELAELLDPGVGVHVNTLYLDPYLWNLHLGANGVIFDLLRAGAPIRGITVSAGIPPLDEATALIEQLTDLGVETVTFKPGTVEGIGQVVEIANAVAPRPIAVHIEGGRAGGHHSWEELDHLLLATYHDLRACPNVVVCVGGGIGDPAVAATYLDGTWALGHGRRAMPLDGILIGTAAMACAEATTSPQVKRLLVECTGTASWIEAGSARDGVASGRSQLGADLHELDNSASRAGRLLDEVAGDAETVRRRHDEIVEAIGRTAKPWFGDVGAMTYLAVLERFAELCAIGRHGRYEDGAWLDESWRDRFISLLQRAEGRLCGPDHGRVVTVFPERADVDDPRAALANLRDRYPDAATTTLHPADVGFFVSVCGGPGKPVPFVPVIDADVRRWWRSDSLWQAHDDRYEADAVVVIPGPTAVAGIDRLDEPIADLFARFETEAAAALAESQPGLRRRRGGGRREVAPEDGPVGVLLGEPTVHWENRRRRNPALAIAPATDWWIDEHGVGHAPGGRATLRPLTRDRVALQVQLERAAAGTENATVEFQLVDGDASAVLVAAAAARRWSDTLLQVATDDRWSGSLHDRRADHAAYFGATAPLPDSLIAVVWPSVFAVLDGSAEGVPLDGRFHDLVHLDHTITSIDASSIGATAGGFQATARMTRIVDTTSGRLLEVGVEVRTEPDGNLVALLTERFLVRGAMGSGLLGGPEPLDSGVGTERRTLTRRTLRSPSVATPTATLTGDHNPLHSSPEIARIAGFARPIVHGMWTSAAMQAVLTGLLAGRDRRLREWQVQFLAPVEYDADVEIVAVRTGRRMGDVLVEVTARSGGVLVAQATGVIAPPTTVYAFPGQGIQRVGMGLEALGRSAAARDVWDRADRRCRDRLGFSIVHVVRDNPEEIVVDAGDGPQRFRHPDGVLFLTQFTQVAMATLASAQIAELREAGAFVPDAVCCGHSVGEYNALAAVSGIIDLEDVVELVYHRGLSMHRLVPRDSSGASDYRLGAARPSEAGLDEAGFLDLVAQIAADGAFIQVVNFNLRGRQYAVAGTTAALDRLAAELEERRRLRNGKGVFVLVPGIDVPFHSDVLRDGVDDFRSKLDAILPPRIDPALLVGRYVPNLVPRLFTLDRGFVEEIVATVPSTALRDVLRDWSDWAQREPDLARVILLELLAWQFASPVRWIETQELLFDSGSGLGIDEFVEVGLGSQPTLTGLAKQTLQQRPAASRAPRILNIDLDRASLYGLDADEIIDDVEVHTEPRKDGPAEHPLAATVTPAPSPLLSPTAVEDIPWTAADGLRLLLSWWTKIRPDQLGDDDTVDGLCDGASSRRNQLLMDLGEEFGLGAIDGAAEAPVVRLAEEVGRRARTYRNPGPVTRVAIDEQLRRVTGPAKSRPTSIAERVTTHWALGPGWALHVAATVASGTRTGGAARGGELGWLTPAAPTSPVDLDALVDAAVLHVAATRGLDVSPPTQEATGTLDAAAATALLDGVLGPDGVLADVGRAIDRHLRPDALMLVDRDTPAAVDLDNATIEAVDRELGSSWIGRVEPAFSRAATLVLDDRWASQREDVTRLAISTTTDSERDSIAGHLRAPLAPAARSHAEWWAGRVDDPAVSDILLGVLRGTSNAPTFADDVALVTGASPGSIAASVVARLLAGGATVVVTSSRLDDERVGFFRDLYHRHASLGASLWLAPANLASFADVDNLTDWLTESPGMTPTILFPFAAPAVSGDLTDVGPRSELDLRVLLLSVERLIARLAVGRSTTGRRDRLHVVLPGSPNRGVFGGDGPYGEAKAAFTALVRRAVAEPAWGVHTSFAHAVIGWVRGTGLMGANDALVDAVERAGITTWSPGEMAERLLALCAPEHRHAAAVAPLDIDLSGGLLDADLDLRSLAAAGSRPDEATGDPDTPATIPALAPPPVVDAHRDEPWTAVTADLADTVVIVGLGEVGPLGSSRTRFEVEVEGRLSAAGVAELAWTCGLICWEQQPRPGFYDVETGEAVPEEDLVERYHDRLLSNSGIRFLEDDGNMVDHTVPLLASVYLDHDLEFVVDLAGDAEAFVAADPENTAAVERHDGTWLVTRRAGTEIRVPRRISLPRRVGAQLPSGFDPSVYGIPADMISALDRVAVWNLVATIDAFLDAGIEPAELLRWVHPADVANTQGTGIGGISAIRAMYVDSLLGEDRPNDVLQEALPNVVAAHVMQSYVGGYGAMVHPVAACATAAVSVEEAFDKIRSGRAEFVVAGGFDDYGPEGLVGFAAMNATASSDEMAAAGVTPARMSRPNDRRRAGFVEGQGGGTVLLARGDVAARLGLPVRGVVAWAGSFSDGVNTSIPAPGVGLVAAARGGAASHLSRRLAALGVTADDIAVVSKHDTSTQANDPNESLVHEVLATSLGRSPGNPLLVVSQKSVTGHAKGGAAAFQIAGLCQVLSSGVIPANRSLDCVDPALERHEHLVWPTSPITSRRRLRAGLVTSLGFGHVAALVAVVHPDVFVSLLPEGERVDYVERSRRRALDGQRRRIAAQVGGPPLYRRPDRRLGPDPDAARGIELTMLVDPSTRLDDAGVLRGGVIDEVVA